MVLHLGISLHWLLQLALRLRSDRLRLLLEHELLRVGIHRTLVLGHGVPLPEETLSVLCRSLLDHLLATCDDEADNPLVVAGVLVRPFNLVAFRLSFVLQNFVGLNNIDHLHCSRY